MRRVAYLAGGSALAIALSLGLSSTALAQEPTEVEAIVVTGSLIAGTPEDAALPVDVIGVEELAKQGSPTTVELLKGLSVSNGVLGDTNQFDARAQGSEGSGSVNLRGLGPTRTLVLINGKRMTINPFALAGAGAVDTNVVPVAAIGRIEVLKDGAAATYGSDAIGGVVNFITRSNFNGLEVNASYKNVDGSDGDYTFGLIGGFSTDRFKVMVAGGYQHRSELSMLERDWALRAYEENPEGGWSAAGNPSTILPLATIANPATYHRDTGCAALGGRTGFSGATPVCQWQYTEWDNLVEKEDRWQIYGQVDVDLSDTTRFHAEAFYAKTEVPEWKTSPSYALLAVPDGVTSPVPGRYYVPANNPGMLAYAAANPGYNFVAGALIAANRPYAMGGNPAFGYGASEGEREYDAFRMAAELSGDLENGMTWSFGAQYSEETGYRSGYDTIVGRYQLALRGLGGADCNGIVAGNPGSTCEWANPFSNAVPSNAITGVANPNYNPALANSVALTRWFFPKLETEQTSGLLVFDALLTGKFEALELGGGTAAWALGGQFRKSTFETWYNDISNRDLNPCLNTPINGSTTCAAPQGPFAFLGVGSPVDLNQDVRAVFGELVLPWTEDFNMTLAARFEDYGGTVGNTFDPKLSVRWQVADQFAVRGSVGTTFRAPTAGQVDGTNFVTSLQNILGVFRAVDIYGNTDLQPETALTYSVGAIIEVGNFNATLDYWNFDFQDPITTEPVAGIVNAVFPGGVPNCAHPLASRFTFQGGVCTVANIARLQTNTVNGADVQTSGIDLLADYTFDDVFGGTLNVGISATYVIEYVTDDTFVDTTLVAAGFDAVGQLNYQTTAYPLPQKKGNVYFEWNSGAHNARWTIRYVDGYRDQRTAPFATNAYRGSDPAGTAFTVSAGKNVDSFLTHDFTYRVFMPWDVTGALTVENVLDEDPPFARLDLNYDPFTASGLGRTWKFSLNKKF
ncbi:MAG TPA: TonB-dependent receptor [Caulobacter sp.]|nr:TonB-dependent receptor [Caulobacter sp.]